MTRHLLKKEESLTLKNAIKTLLMVAAATLCALLLGKLAVGNESVIMVFLLGVLFTAMLTSSRAWALGAALLCAMLFNFLFTEPRFSFFIYSSNDLVLVGFFLLTGIVSGSVTSKLQNEMQLANRSERTAKTLYRIASGFVSVSGRDAAIQMAKDTLREHTGLDCEVCLGRGCEEWEGYDIRSGPEVLGKLSVSADALEEQRRLIVQAVCTQLGIALERESLVADRERISLAMEREQQRGALLRSIAHDLRSPLTALSGAGSLLADTYDRLSDAERRKLASDISEETLWLTDLVENILNMTRISEQKLVLRKQDEVIDDVMGEAIKHTERLLRARELRVVLPEQVATVPMDGKLIAQVIVNLLENAALHTPEQSSITLGATITDHLTVWVADTGEGIPEALRGRLFERFATQNEQIADGRRGLGLGLSICKAIVEAHGGSITARDNSPKGAVFEFTLPMEEQHE